MRTIIAYYEKRIADKETAIYEIVQSGMAARIITQVVEGGVQKMVKDIIDQSSDLLEYRTVRAKCLNAHPNQRDKIIRQIWSVCNYFARHGGRVIMPEQKRKKSKNETTNHIAGVPTVNGHDSGRHEQSNAGMGLERSSH